MSATRDWARRRGISPRATPPQVASRAPFTARTARDVAARAVVLQGVVAAACDVDPRPIVRWYRSERLWPAVSPRERAFLLGRASLTAPARLALRRQQEAEWTLLWALGRVEALGLPTRACDTRRLVDELIPPLGASLGPFLAGARLRRRAELLAEDDRTYDLYCAGVAAHRAGRALPRDLVWPVLVERRCAFEWLTGDEGWDEVTCDA